MHDGGLRYLRGAAKLAEYGGRIVKTMGDGVLVEFASAVDAVQHAIEVQRDLAKRNEAVSSDFRIELRIGINVGDIIVEEEDIFGDGVNIAARLEGLADPGGICISGTVFDQIGKKLELPYDDLGEQSVKNISEPVRTYRVRIESGVSTITAAKAGHGEALPLPVRPSIAVMPFDNMSGDPEQEYFSDGITEDIITAFSRVRRFFVIARNSTFAYKGKKRDVREIGRELGVLLSASVCY